MHRPDASFEDVMIHGADLNTLTPARRRAVSRTTVVTCRILALMSVATHFAPCFWRRQADAARSDYARYGLLPTASLNADQRVPQGQGRFCIPQQARLLGSRY